MLDRVRLEYEPVEKDLTPRRFQPVTRFTMDSPLAIVNEIFQRVSFPVLLGCDQSKRPGTAPGRPEGTIENHLISSGELITVVRVAASRLFSPQIARSGSDPIPEEIAMFESPLMRIRRCVGLGMFGVSVFGVLSWFTPGWPVLWGPSAPTELRQAGLELFQHDWEPNDPQAHGDGLGPVFNARSCVECHFQGGVGGGGDNSHNVTAFEAFPTPDRSELKGGLIHRFAVASEFLEGPKELNNIFPILHNASVVQNGCQIVIPEFNPVHTENVNSPPSLARMDRPDLGKDHPAAGVGVSKPRGQGAGRRLQRCGGRQATDPAGRPRRQVRLEGSVRHARGVRGRRVCQRDRAGESSDASGQADRLRQLPARRERPEPGAVPLAGCLRGHITASHRAGSERFRGARKHRAWPGALRPGRLR